MNQLWLVLWLCNAVKWNDFLFHANCIYLMPDLFFSYYGQNYAHYLIMLSVMMANINETCPDSIQILKNDAFIVIRSTILGCHKDVDKTGGDLHETLQVPCRNQRIWFEKDIALVWLTEDELALPMISFRISWYFFLFLENGYKIVLSYEFKDVYFCFTCSFYSSIDIRCK